MTETVVVRRTFICEYECALSDYEEITETWEDVVELEMGITDPHFFVGQMEQVDVEVSLSAMPVQMARQIVMENA